LQDATGTALNTCTLDTANNLSVASVTFTSLLVNGGGAGSATLSYANTATSSAIVIPTIAAGDTLVGKATTDTLTNKTFNTAGTGNVFQINSVGITAVKGNSATVQLNNGALTSGNVITSDANGNTVDGGVVATGYQMQLKTTANHSPNDTTIYYWGNTATPNSTYGNGMYMVVPKACTVKRVVYTVCNSGGTVGSNETVALVVRLNNTTDFASGNMTFDMGNTACKQTIVTGVSTALAVGDIIAAKIPSVTWATNPTNLLYSADVYCE
jgi:hypothetical protein